MSLYFLRFIAKVLLVDGAREEGETRTKVCIGELSIQRREE